VVELGGRRFAFGERSVSHQQSQVMQRFIAMLEEGDYLKSRG